MTTQPSCSCLIHVPLSKPRVIGKPTRFIIAVAFPALIRVVFDRPMKDKAWSLVGSGPEMPEAIGAPTYDAARTIWTVPVRLKPGHSYRFMLNSDRFRAFQSEDGASLEPVTVRFQTQK